MPELAALLPADLETAIDAADLRVLLLCLFHLTGDEIWLSPPYVPARDTRLIPDPDAGLPAEVRREIRAAAVTLLRDGVPAPAIPTPTPQLFGRMMSHCLGEQVADEYIPMMYADFGFAPETEVMSAPVDPALDVVVIGAGVSGICLAAKLHQFGIRYTVLERHTDVGGTWFENRYPGCGVDTPNHFYSYSFRPNPAWRYYFSPRSELQEYLETSATELGIRDSIRFNTTVRAVRWDEAAHQWHVSVHTPAGEIEDLTARVVVSATGHFSQPRHVAFAGLEEFRGRTFHTARWPEGTDLSGLHVGVIGTGASAMQTVPAIVDDVSTLTVFQRTPQWIRPVREYSLPVDPASRWLFQELPYYGRWYRFVEFWRFGDGLLNFLRRDPTWPHPDRSINRGNERHRLELVEYLEQQLEGRPDLIEKCLPNYPPFGKRMLIDNGWYAALRQPHVELVTEPIERFVPEGIRDASGVVHKLDAVVLATGFDIVHVASEIDIVGVRGRRLADDWANENPTAHLGMTVPMFPNLFVMFGPNTNMGHGGSAMWLAETQSRFIIECLKTMSAKGVTAMEVREEVRGAYTREIDSLHEHLIWSHPGVQTYYRNRHGQVRSPMPFRLVDYWHLTRAPDLEEHHLRRATTDRQSSVFSV